MSAKPRPVILDDLALNIFTDGSSFSGPRAGGIGIRIITFEDDGNEVPDDYLLPGYQHATNQEMELKACIEALRIISGRRSPVNVRDYTKVVIHTDSQYVVDYLHNAFTSWPRDRWQTRDGKPVAAAGDFGTYQSRDAARISFALSAFADADRSPLDASIFSLDYDDYAATMYETLLPRLPELLDHPDRSRTLWEDEDDFGPKSTSRPEPHNQ